MFDVTPNGRLKSPALEWAQQFLEPYQLWYASHKGDMPKRPEPGRAVVIRPISSLNTPFAPADPVLTNNTSKHVRDYCLFVRFLVERVVSAIGPAVAARKKSGGRRSSRSDFEVEALIRAELAVDPSMPQAEFCRRYNEPKDRVSRELKFEEIRKDYFDNLKLAHDEGIDLSQFQVRKPRRSRRRSQQNPNSSEPPAAP